jgi:hypothetical protein
MVIMNSELEMMWSYMVVAHFQVTSEYLFE